MASLADSAGAQLGGAVVAVLGAAHSICLDVASYLACALLLGSIRTPFTELPLLLAAPGHGGQVGIAAGLFVQLACATAQGSTQRSIRQAVCDPGMQGRMLATSQWITYGTRPLAALLAGAAGTWLGLWNSLALGTAALILPFLLLSASSIRSMHHVPGAPPASRPRLEGEPA
ncbi:hypothetical protein ABZ419_28255 [Streptomyces cinnamoneus]|uniref:hypothetical protein n=1 Tax=Streptomyces cinnamoneus TaxID=53446 RepID=UPI0033D011C4